MAPSPIVETLRAAGCVFAEEEAELLLASAGTPEELRAMVERRVTGLPLEHVVGWAEFCGLRVAVDVGVFVPRRRTELLAREAIALAREAVAVNGGPATVLDMCCGSGAVGAAIARTVPGISLVAADLDPVAVRCARRNLEPLGAEVFAGDLFTALPERLRGRVDVLVANVPYVPSAAVPLLPAEARLFEPRGALDGGADGLDLLRRVSGEAPRWLAPGGHLLFEVSPDQVPAAREAVLRAGLRPRVVRDDEPPAIALVATPAR